MQDRSREFFYGPKLFLAGSKTFAPLAVESLVPKLVQERGKMNSRARILNYFKIGCTSGRFLIPLWSTSSLSVARPSPSTPSL